MAVQAIYALRNLVRGSPKGKKQTPEHIAKRFSLSARSNMSKAGLGKVISEATREKRSKALTGREITWGAKISQAIRLVNEKKGIAIAPKSCPNCREIFQNRNKFCTRPCFLEFVKAHGRLTNSVLMPMRG